MFARWIIPVVALPGTALVFVPALILWLSKGTRFAAAFASPDTLPFWAGVLLAIPGILLAVSSASLFFRFGDGTAAPWDPPKKLVVHGPYRHVRNPMLTGVIILLAAESLLLQSWPIAAWTAVFGVANAIYFPLSEEPALAKRHGEAYRIYCKNVPRWVPRIRPWDPGDPGAN